MSLSLYCIVKTGHKSRPDLRGGDRDFTSSSFFNVYLFLRERERERERRMSRGGAERERETQNPKQAPGSEVSAQSPTWGSNS